ncbi:hypothetical protein F2Q69_00054062 [Brassica cretica]|uniref:Uncharacterized protein n=1 Tax=Brassica cretica TaxID=69181 RepID=A0A8S9N4Z3_BRACR|nr:hypothetical protein F2Q69_00054062 [Brassica cretica]
MNHRNIPRDMFLGIYRGTHSSEYTEGLDPRNFSEGSNSEEMNPRNIPRDTFLGIYRGTCSSEFSEGSFPRKFPTKIPRNISSKPPRFFISGFGYGGFSDLDDFWARRLPDDFQEVF